MKANLFKYTITVFLSFILFQKTSLGQNILTQTNFSSTYNDEQIGQNNFSYRINFLLTYSNLNSNNYIFPGLLQPIILNSFVEDNSYSLYSPTAFSPDGDGINDLFKVYGQGMSDFKIEIFNRWGQMIYKSFELSKGWDGTFKGKNLPTGSYVYKIKTSEYSEDKKLVKTGTVALVR
ncbi:MAG: gliding motility-associated C-terminal domain-containing protein [Flavobacteriales bacterium]|nr:gliding motility-associated C-terminal domain-containing protein [Flavobacteriales bacterium]